MHVWMQDNILSSTPPPPPAMAYHPLMDRGHPINEASRLHLDTQPSVRYLWTSDQPELCLLGIYK
jgi:hypothetical protein